MPRMNDKPTLGEAVRESLTTEFQTEQAIHEARSAKMGEVDPYPGTMATRVILIHMAARGEAERKIEGMFVNSWRMIEPASALTEG